MEKKDNSKTYLIIIALLLFVIGIGFGYFLGTNNNAKLESSEKTEEKKEEKKEEEKIVVEGSLVSNGDSVTKDIVLNGKSNTLALLDGSEIKMESYMKFGTTSLDKLVRYGTGSDKAAGYHEMPKLNYHVVEGVDGKEYLVVYYDYSFQHVLLVLNDETKIIGEFKNHIQKSFDCFANFDEIEATLFEIKNNDVYYYKYDDKEKVGDIYEDAIKMKLVKLEINNNKVNEIETETSTTGKFFQCQ